MEAQLQQLIDRLDRIESKLSKMTPNDVSFNRMRNDVIYKANHKGYKPRPETIKKIIWYLMKRLENTNKLHLLFCVF